MSKTMIIDGVTFEQGNDSTALLNPYNGFEHVTDAYTKASPAKETIYEYWENFFYSSDTMRIHRFGIIAHNSFKFTIGALVEIDGTMYNVVITDCHNRISRVVD